MDLAVKHILILLNNILLVVNNNAQASIFRLSCPSNAGVVLSLPHARRSSTNQPHQQSSPEFRRLLAKISRARLPLSYSCAFEHLTLPSSLPFRVAVPSFRHLGAPTSFARDFCPVQAYGEIPVCLLASSWRTQQAAPAIRPSFVGQKRRAAPIDYGAILTGDSKKRSSDPFSGKFQLVRLLRAICSTQPLSLITPQCCK